ncbi:hypothetical protein GYA44_00350 [Candidatus Microgenomates bacterium]|jgi:hypothetical protein|nr:hypothetical protein [Candidatus Microgenomates bacterium]
MDNSVIITIVILFLVTVLFVFVSLNNNRISQGRKKKLLVKLEELRAFAYSNEPAIRRDAVIKLDNLLAKALQYYFNNTNLCGENLKLANKIFKKKDYNTLWDAHKTRNMIVHDDYDISEEESKQIYEIYKMSIIKIIK